MIKYDEPGEYGNVTVYVTRDRAIELQREYSIQKHGRDIYESDELALDDFRLLHGAWEMPLDHFWKEEMNNEQG